MRGHEVAQKVDVPTRRPSPMRRLWTVETDVLLDDVPVGDARAAHQLRVTPAIDPISRFGAALERGIQLPRFSLEEGLGLAIVGIENDRQIEPEPAIHVLDAS